MDVSDALAHSPFSQSLGCRVVRLEEGLAEVAMALTDTLRNRLGKLHGGAMFSLVDVAMGLACSTAHGFDKSSVTLECKINYIRAVSDGEVACIARVVHAGRRTLVVDAEVLQNDKLMAKAQATFAAL